MTKIIHLAQKKSKAQDMLQMKMALQDWKAFKDD